jgi:SAM-dependent methyltransferase
MKASFLPIFYSKQFPELPLSFVGEQEGDNLINGSLLAGEQQVGQVMQGIASFVDSDNWPPEEMEKLKREGWIRIGWDNGINIAANLPTRGDFCDKLAAIDGIIFEMAAGPGGGLLPPVLKRNAGVKLLINDSSISVLKEWQAFLKNRSLDADLGFAAFDAREMPLRDASIAAISGVLGFGSIGGTDCFEEAYRVLQPGGQVFSIDMIVDPTDWSRMPADRRRIWEQDIPGMVCGVANLLKQAGFQIESSEILPGRTLVPDEGGLPRDAADHGVTLRVVWEYIRAIKPISRP